MEKCLGCSLGHSCISHARGKSTEGKSSKHSSTVRRSRVQYSQRSSRLSIEASFNATDERGEPKAQFALILTICHAALLVGLWFKEEEGGEREEEELAGGGRKSARLAAKRAKKAQKAA